MADVFVPHAAVAEVVVPEVVATNEVVADGLLEGVVRPLQLLPHELLPRVIDEAIVEIANLHLDAKYPQAEQDIAAT